MTRRMFRSYILPIVVGVGILTIAFWAASKLEEPSNRGDEVRIEASGFLVPDFELSTLTGETIAPSQFRGKVVLINFWATWCAPCKKEIPDFISLQRHYGNSGVQILGIALDDEKSVRKYSESAGFNYPILLGTDGTSQLFGGIPGIPTTFVVDREGMIVRKYEGYQTRAVFENDIKMLIEAPNNHKEVEE